MTELEKCMAGELYNCHDQVFLEFKEQSRRLISVYNGLAYSEKRQKQGILSKLLGSVGNNVSVGTPFL